MRRRDPASVRHWHVSNLWHVLRLVAILKRSHATMRVIRVLHAASRWWLPVSRRSQSVKSQPITVQTTLQVKVVVVSVWALYFLIHSIALARLTRNCKNPEILVSSIFHWIVVWISASLLNRHCNRNNIQDRAVFDEKYTLHLGSEDIKPARASCFELLRAIVTNVTSFTNSLSLWLRDTSAPSLPLVACYCPTSSDCTTHAAVENSLSIVAASALLYFNALFLNNLYTCLFGFPQCT